MHESQRPFSPDDSSIYMPNFADTRVNKFDVSIDKDGTLNISYNGKYSMNMLEKKDSGEFFHFRR